MERGISCIMLIDDDHPTNVLHRLIIESSRLVKKIIIFDNGADALIYLNGFFNKAHPKPDIIFLDINMPGMTGWEFLDEYKKLPEEKKIDTQLLMLSTSSHPEDLARAEQEDIVKEYLFKPLTEEIVHKVANSHSKKLQENLTPITVR